MEYARRLAPVLLLASLALPVFAQQARSERCEAMDAALPGEFGSWASRTPLAIGQAIEAGRAVDLRLVPTADARYAIAPARAPKAGDFGGAVTTRVATAGTYRIALGQPGWIDVVRDGKALESVAHGHGPECATIRKIVDFRLEPGEYIIQVSGAPQAKAALMIARRP